MANADRQMFLSVKIEGAEIDPDRVRIGNARLYQPIEGHHEFEAECLSMTAGADPSSIERILETLHEKIKGKLEVAASYGSLSAARDDGLNFVGILTCVSKPTSTMNTARR